MNVLVDTSVWSLALRRKSQNLNPIETATVSELSNLIEEGRARIIGLVRQELLSGIKTSIQFEKLLLTLRSFPDEIVPSSDYELAAKASNKCRANGLVVSVSDILICAVAIARNWAVLAVGPDFRAYANILPLKLHILRK